MSIAAAAVWAYRGRWSGSCLRGPSALLACRPIPAAFFLRPAPPSRRGRFSASAAALDDPVVASGPARPAALLQGSVRPGPAPGTALLSLRVKPRSSRPALFLSPCSSPSPSLSPPCASGFEPLRLIAQIPAPPVENQANAQLLDLLSRKLGLRKPCFELWKGAKGREKTVLVREDQRRLAERLLELVRIR